MQTESNPERKFVPAVLPWVLGAAAFLLYILTLNHWITFNSLGHVARAIDWARDPALVNPVYLAVTYPIRWLPAHLIPLGLNLFSAVCGAVAVGLIARCVALLPQDRTEEQRVRCHSAFSIFTGRNAWLPPVLAAVLLGLQISFWEDATVASTEILDLLLFAYVVRCLLEFRVKEQDSWLVRAALVYGAGITNNWAMIGFFPLFIAALIWIKRSGFLNIRFLMQMFAAGSVGLLFYLLLPLVHTLSGEGNFSFWQGLKYNLVFQKNFVSSLLLNKPVLFMGDPPLWVLILPSLVPILIMAIRWPSFFGDSSRLGMLLTRWILHFFHAFLLVFCIWIALDSELSPRNYHPSLYPSGLHLLPFYFLGALSVGYFAAYLLLVFGEKPPKRTAFIFKEYPPYIAYPALGLVWGMAVFALFGMVYRNLPQIRVTNGSLYRDFASLSARNLPGTNTVAYSDDPRRTFLLYAAAQKERAPLQQVLVDTAFLKDPQYHDEMVKKHPNVWLKPPAISGNQPVDDLVLLALAAHLGESNKLFYLHPSFGYYFEAFYQVPQGMVYELRRYPTNSLLLPSLSGEVIQRNETYWRDAEPFLSSLTSAIAPTNNPRWADRLFEKLRLPPAPNQDATYVGGYLSRALNYWGVQMQRQGKLPEAARHFENAVKMNPRNLVAALNLEENRIQQSGEQSQVVLSPAMDEAFGEHQDIRQVMNANGPFDSASFCFRQGQEFARGNNFVQALQQFHRVSQLSSNNLSAQLAMAQIYSRVQQPQKALEIVRKVRAQPLFFGIGRSNVLEVTAVEATAHLVANDPARADEAFKELARQYPDADIRAAAGQLFLSRGYHTNAIQWFDMQLKTMPNDPGALGGKAMALLSSGKPDEADQLLQKVAQAQNNTELFGEIAQRFINAGFPTNAIPWLDRQLKKDPGNGNVLVNMGFAWLQARSYSNALPILDKALNTLDPKEDQPVYFTALLNRAIAHLQSGNLDKAKADYQQIEDKFPESYQVQYGLAEIAYRQKDTNLAIKHYQLYLTNAPANTLEAKEVTERLQTLKPPGK